MGKTLRDYNPPADQISELTDIRGGVSGYSDIARNSIYLPAMSQGDTRARQTKDEPNKKVSSSLHPFKVTSSIDPDTEEWLYEVYQGVAGNTTILTTDPKLTVPDGNFIYVTFTRNTSSREVTDAILENGDEVPESTELNQYIAIAKVNAGDIVQHRFEDIRVTEILISEAGELKFISVFDTTNTYDLP